jgi:putative transposase
LAHHNTVFSQLLKFVPRHVFERLAKCHHHGRKKRVMTRWTQFVALSLGHLGGRSSLRDIESSMDAQQCRRYHLGCNAVRRSSLARANEAMPHEFYVDLFQQLYRRCCGHGPRHGFRFNSKLFSLDASLIDVSMQVFPWADYNSKKAAFKLHLGLDHDGHIPSFVAITRGKVSETKVAPKMDIPPRSVVVFDKGYSDYGWYKALNDKGIYFVTRQRTNARYTLVERRTFAPDTGVTSDQIIRYTSQRSSRKHLPLLRRVGYRDPDTGKHYVFVTNQFSWSPKTVAQIYKQRWQIELFFKWIKQNLKIKTFLGTTQNAVMTQVLVALCLYLLLSYIKFTSKLTRSLQQILRLIQLNLFVRRALGALLGPPVHIKTNPPPQLTLSLGTS